MSFLALAKSAGARTPAKSAGAQDDKIGVNCLPTLKRETNEIFLSKIILNILIFYAKNYIMSVIIH